jgi:hypothetical protein
VTKRWGRSILLLLQKLYAVVGPKSRCLLKNEVDLDISTQSREKFHKASKKLAVTNPQSARRHRMRPLFLPHRARFYFE